MEKGKILTELTVKKAAVKAKPYKLADSGGLYLLINPNGSRYWRLKYRISQKEKVLALGVYPDVPLREARDKRDDAKKLIRDGYDPSALKQEKKREAERLMADSFEALTREWFEKQQERWSENHAHRIITSMEKDIFPFIGGRPVDQITTPEILGILRKVEKREALDVAKRLKQRCGSVFSYARQTGRMASANPVADLARVLKTRKVVHRLALAKSDMPEFLEQLNNYQGDIITRLAFMFMVLTIVRPGEARGARWEEFDFKDKQWRIPAHRMKMREEHIVPLSKQALKILEEVKKLTGNQEYLFSLSGQKPLSENTLIYALYRMGYHKRATAHGFRATASTILNESGFPPDVIERQLAHAETNQVRAAYNRSQYLPQRIKMMEWWGSYLEGLTIK